VQIFSLKKLTCLEVWGKIQGENPKKLASLENSDDSASINSILDNFERNIRIRAEERLDPWNGGSMRYFDK